MKKSQTLEDIIKKSKWYYTNDNLTTKNFPIPKTIETENWKLITLDIWTSSKECLQKIKDAGCRPANAYELALWANNHREEVPKGKWYVAFGQTCFIDGDHRVPGVGAYSGGGFDFDLGSFEDDWDSNDVLLCFCDKELDTLSSRLKNVEQFMKDNFKGFHV